MPRQRGRLARFAAHLNFEPGPRRSPPRNTQALARHSTIDLTMNVYTNGIIHDLSRDVKKLSALGVAQGDTVGVARAVPSTRRGSDLVNYHLQRCLVCYWNIRPSGLKTFLRRSFQAAYWR